MHIMCAGGAISAGGGGLSAACQFPSNPRKLTSGKLLDEAHAYIPGCWFKGISSSYK